MTRRIRSSKTALENAAKMLRAGRFTGTPIQ